MTSSEPVRDEAGRIVAPPQSIVPARTAGPWDQNGGDSMTTSEPYRSPDRYIAGFLYRRAG
jgi:hypothetical protein